MVKDLAVSPLENLGDPMMKDPGDPPMVKDPGDPHGEPGGPSWRTWVTPTMKDPGDPLMVKDLGDPHGEPG